MTTPGRPQGRRTLAIRAGQHETLSFGPLKAGQTYTLLVTLESGRLAPDDRVTVELIRARRRQVRSKNCTPVTPTSIFPIGPHATATASWCSRGSQATGDSALVRSRRMAGADTL